MNLAYIHDPYGNHQEPTGGGNDLRMCWISWGIDPEGIGPHESPWPEHKSSEPNVALGWGLIRPIEVAEEEENEKARSPTLPQPQLLQVVMFPVSPCIPIGGGH